MFPTSIRKSRNLGAPSPAMKDTSESNITQPISAIAGETLNIQCTQAIEGSESVFQPSLSKSRTRTIEVRLPLEMHEHIIGFLDNETELGTIARCALVCRAWLPFSRYKLYYRIFLSHCVQWYRFRGHMVRPASHIVPYLGMVRELHISQTYFTSLFNAGDAAARSQSSQNDTLGRCKLYPYRSLTALRLDRCVFSSIEQMQQLVCAFPSLSHLVLRRISLQRPMSPTIPHLRPPEATPRLAHVEIDDCFFTVSTALCQWLADAGLVRHTSHLVWRPVRIEVLSQIWKRFSIAIDSEALELLECVLPRTWQGLHFPFSSFHVLFSLSLSLCVTNEARTLR